MFIHRLNNVENAVHDRSLWRSFRGDSTDPVLVLDEPAKGSLQKRLDASSSLLSSFTHSDTNGSKYDGFGILHFFCLVKFFNTLKSLLIIKERDKMHYSLSFTATVFQPLATEFSICCFPAVEYSVAALVSNSI